MSWGNGKAFETPYDHVIVTERDGGWVVCKANYHTIQQFGPGEEGKHRAEGHAHGIAETVFTED